jgi:putative ABC transport system permease protein
VGAGINPVTPGFFRTFGIRRTAGREFSDDDRDTAPRVAMVNRAFAQAAWPAQDPIGKRVRHGFRVAYGDPKDWTTVVGVVEDARYREVETPRFDLYLPYRQAPSHVQHFVVRASGDPMAVVPQIRAAVATIGAGVTVEGISTMNEIVARVRAPWRFTAVVVALFSVLALAFAAVGLAALIAYAVTQRTHEIGVRMALGAQRRHVVTLLLKEGLQMTIAGLAVGVLAAWMLRRTVATMLFGISPADAATFSAVPLMLLVVALLAAYLPARRAARIDPAVALRSE